MKKPSFLTFGKRVSYLWLDNELTQEELQYNIDYAIENNIENFITKLENIEILNKLPKVSNLIVKPIFSEEYDFDYSPVYELKDLLAVGLEVDCLISFLPWKEIYTFIDYSKMKSKEKIEFAAFHDSKYHLNKTCLTNLKTLIIFDDKSSKDLYPIFSSKNLDSLEVSCCNIQSLDGIQQTDNLQFLSLNYNRRLSDISQLSKFKDTLLRLDIENCGKITDFSVLNELTSLRSLHLRGNNKLQNLDFIKNMNLQDVIIEYEIMDKDTSNLLDINWVRIKNRKDYNHKSKEFKQINGEDVLENVIPKWRSIFYI